MKRLIADSGATKTDWCLIKGNEILKHYSGKGISPVFQTEDQISNEIHNNVFPEFKEWNISKIHFYGSGCIAENIPIVKSAIFKIFPIETIEVYSDLIAAAHSLCGHKPGIACILGTGSNSCEWDGNRIINQISPLGFILGDEGSGAYIGKKLIGDALKNQLTPGLKELLLDEYELTPSIIIDKVYRQPFPSRFLASLSPFISKHLDDESIRQIVINSFNDFFKRNIMQYNFSEKSVNFVGSIAWYYSDILKETAQLNGIITGKILKSPMIGLIEYYSKTL
ncbi:MAG: ATPase [Fermentimonas sp.]|uniref:ATPase n=1 Tax=Lascolabacillus sp. TaxID=1924068 RepID=UPI001B532733|nr:ATPase [Lascolabacillus sp.]MBP6175562.1 ATPase [Fermentimonas sp.]MDI9626361.1 ATPase [Bacteroidota bacterium]MBP6196012.1 ATPase [Fermentimonas sp.]MBP7104223.1 ATPase [Fermentimonas sp.]MCK9500747.1 ATPase [Lascolabacillus sp.]